MGLCHDLVGPEAVPSPQGSPYSPAASKPWPQTKREARAEILASFSLHLLPPSPALKLDSSMSPFSHLWGS